MGDQPFNSSDFLPDRKISKKRLRRALETAASELRRRQAQRLSDSTVDPTRRSYLSVLITKEIDDQDTTIVVTQITYLGAAEPKIIFLGDPLIVYPFYNVGCSEYSQFVYDKTVVDETAMPLLAFREGDAWVLERPPIASGHRHARIISVSGRMALVQPVEEDFENDRTLIDVGERETLPLHPKLSAAAYEKHIAPGIIVNLELYGSVWYIDQTTPYLPKDLGNARLRVCS